MAEYSYTVLFEPADEGGFVVTCPALPGLVTEGDTLEEARAMAEDAIRGYIESLRKDRLPIPSDKAPVKEEIHVLGARIGVSRRVPVLKPKDVLRALERAGFAVHHVTGSHYILKHPEKVRLRVTLPWHNKDLKRGTLRSIIGQAGYTMDEFADLL